MNLVEYSNTLDTVEELDGQKVILDGNEKDVRYIKIQDEKSFKTTYKVVKNIKSNVGRYVDVFRLTQIIKKSRKYG